MMQGGQTFAEGEFPMGSPDRILAADDHSSVTSEVSPIIEDATDKSAQIRPPVKAEPVSSDRSVFRKFHQKAALTLQKANSKLSRLWDQWQPAFSNLEMERLLQNLPVEPLGYEKVSEMTQNMPEFDGKQILTLGRNPSFDRSAIRIMIERRQPFFVKGGKGKFWSFDLSSEAPDAHFVWTDKIPKNELSQLKQAARRAPMEAAEGAEEAAGIAREGLESPETATQAARSLEESTIGHTTAFSRSGVDAGGLSARPSKVPSATAGHPTVPSEGLTGMTADASTRAASEAAPEGALDSGRVSELTGFWEREADRQMSRSSSSKSVEQATRSAPTEAAEIDHLGITPEGLSAETRPVILSQLGSTARIIPSLEPAGLVPYRGARLNPWRQALSPANKNMVKFLESRPVQLWGQDQRLLANLPKTDDGKFIVRLSKGDHAEGGRVTALTHRGEDFYVVNKKNKVWHFEPKKDAAKAFTWTDDVTYRQKNMVRQALKAQPVGAAAESSRPLMQKVTEGAGNLFRGLSTYLHAR